MKTQNTPKTADLVVDNSQVKKEKKSIFQLLSDIENSTLNLETIPTILNLLINDFHLDNKTLEEPEIYDLVARHDMIYDTVVLARNVIIDTLEELERVIEETEIS